ncbi:MULTISPECIES: DedA family protein [Actinosynnema]|uniref:DedA family protein n=1 Tax=Actinosynnema TaxID=40566 RepID=UPI0020A5FC65|nr:DedA family protein [Actinosynnema pretiosum]MCP2099455.1 membrane protein DedA, SNARE-associated domain [Actinosynnema pretiosum]
MVLDFLRDLPPALVLALVFALPALEASTMLGVVFPGEVAVLVGGAVAHSGGAPLWAVLVAAISGAVIGDATGYFVGSRYGHRMIQLLPERLVKPEHLAKAEELLRRRGGVAVLVGRFTALLRALVPALAGMSRVPLRTFLLFNALGGVLWASGVALLGYGAGASLQLAEHRLGLASEIVLGVLVVAGAVVWLRRRKARRT